MKQTTLRCVRLGKPSLRWRLFRSKTGVRGFYSPYARNTLRTLANAQFYTEVNLARCTFYVLHRRHVCEIDQYTAARWKTHSENPVPNTGHASDLCSPTHACRRKEERRTPSTTVTSLSDYGGSWNETATFVSIHVLETRSFSCESVGRYATITSACLSSGHLETKGLWIFRNKRALNIRKPF